MRGNELETSGTSEYHELATGLLALGEAEGNAVEIDLTKLVETRMIVQANSGGGKTWAIRRLLEQSYGRIQHVILDVEGSLRTLRERYDYLLLGSDTDTVDYPITPENAGDLAIKLLELRTSVILDLYEMVPRVRQQVVCAFLESLINAPKTLWHDCLVVVDEAHIFCPERENPPAKPSIEALCSRGRARGFCAILATQRISKLGKDALGECNNKLIGRASLDLDMRRSNAELEFPTSSQLLKRLAPGEFYVFGPAFQPSTEVQRVIVGPVETTHPKAGSRRQIASPPPPANLQAVLAVLQSLPLPEVMAHETASSPKEAGQKNYQRAGTMLHGASHSVLPTLPTSPQWLGEERIKQLEKLLESREAEIVALKEQIEMLKKLPVSLPSPILPETLSITHATVEHVTLPPLPVPQGKVIDSVPHPGVGATPHPARTNTHAVSTEGISSMEQAKFNALKKRVSQVSRGELQMLRVLIEQQGIRSVREIALWLNKAEATVRKHPPITLLALQLIARERRGNGYVYWSTMNMYLKREFPQANTLALQEQIMLWLPKQT